jgi:hypothetical protein
MCVDVGDEAGRLGAQFGHVDVRRARPVALEALPVPFHRAETRAHRVVPGHEQRAFRIAFAQQLQTALEGLHLLAQRRVVGGGQRQAQPVGLHAHAAGLVHRGGAAFELPRHPQRGGNGQQ